MKITPVVHSTVFLSIHHLNLQQGLRLASPGCNTVRIIKMSLFSCAFIVFPSSMRWLIATKLQTPQKSLLTVASRCPNILIMRDLHGTNIYIHIPQDIHIHLELQVLSLHFSSHNLSSVLTSCRTKRVAGKLVATRCTCREGGNTTTETSTTSMSFLRLAQGRKKKV